MERIKYGELSVLLTVLAMYWLVTDDNLTSKDDLTSQALNKLLELQRTLVILSVIMIIVVLSPPTPFVQ